MTLLSFLGDPDLSILITLGFISIFSWFVSTLSGGGSSLLLMPSVGLLLGAKFIAPATTVGAIVGNGDRVIAYRQYIQWQVIFWEVPGAFLGSFLGAFVLTKIQGHYLGILVGLFLIFSAITFFVRKGQEGQDSDIKTFKVAAWYFLPAGFCYATLSGIMGGMGPLLAPLYLNFGLQKESLLGTQATARMVIHITKLIAYELFGILTKEHFIYGIIIGMAAIIGNWMGNFVLRRMSDKQFRQGVMGFVFFGGLLMLWQNLSFQLTDF